MIVSFGIVYPISYKLVSPSKLVFVFVNALKSNIIYHYTDAIQGNLRSYRSPMTSGSD